MKRLTVITALLTAIIVSATAQVNTWRAYMSYQEPQQIVKAGSSDLFVRASNGLYQYNLNDQSITTFDKVRQLSDTHVQLIAWNQQVKRLIVVYQNSNIDLLDLNQNVTNISSLYYKSMMQDKTVNSIYINNEYAYLATNFGVVKLNMQRAEIAESYILNAAINAIGISGNNIYVRKKDGTVLTCDMSKNLIDSHNWTTGTAPAGLFNTDNTDWDNYIETVKTLQPNGPKYNYFNYMKFENNKLYTTGGGWRDGTQFYRAGCAQILDDNDNWNCITDLVPLYGSKFLDATCIVQDKNDENHLFISTCGTGLYELRNGQVVKNYTEGNSPLNSSAGDNPDYVRVEGLIYDSNGMLWMSCSSQNSKGNIILRLNTATEEWKMFDNDILYNKGNRLRIIRHSLIDKDGNIWMANDHHDFACLFKIEPENDKITRYSNFTNQDGTTTIINFIRCMAMDLDNHLWIGTDQGLFMYDENQLEDPDLGVTQIKVPRNDGTNYADYLMSGVDISAIAIDGANRKWIGTDGSGVYLISADNMEQIYHFTTENSDLISDNVESLAIDNATGRVYIGTLQGLCSYDTDATAASIEMTKDNVYAYPNPVTSDYDGNITIVGLSFNADVKILSVSGKLIAQGRSNGGTFTWNGRDSQGRRVASGIYMVAAATSEGKKGTVCKIAIVR